MAVKERSQIKGTDAQIKAFAGHNGVLAFATDTKSLHVLSGTAGTTTEFLPSNKVATKDSLSGYATKQELGAYATSEEVNTELAKKANISDVTASFAKYTPTANLAKVATSGSYNDLSDKPTFSSISLLDVYPIGSIYTSVSATDPSTLFGGTWAAIAEGRVLIGAGSGYTAGGTGGSASHSITISEMPSHNHGGSTGSVGAGGSHVHSDNNFASSGGSALKDGEIASPQEGSSYGSGRMNTGSANGMPQHAHTITSQGSGAAMSLMQPYLVVYMWKRTA